jgi:hypothetical protein
MKMKIMFTGLVLLVLSGNLAKAQLPKVNTNAATAVANPGQLITQFTNAIKPTSFTSGWAVAKDGILGKAQKVSNAMEMANTVSTLVSFIKPDMFKQGSTAKSLMDMSGKVKTMTEAAGLLKSFEGGLKPEALTSKWATVRPGWLNALNQLK